MCSKPERSRSPTARRRCARTRASSGRIWERDARLRLPEGKRSNVILVYADLGAKALYLLYIWLASAIAAAELSKRKGYGEKPGLGTGLLLSAIGILVWLLVPAKDDSEWARGRRPRPGGQPPGGSA